MQALLINTSDMSNTCAFFLRHLGSRARVPWQLAPHRESLSAGLGGGGAPRSAGGPSRLPSSAGQSAHAGRGRAAV